jgi:hypothetical protein
MFPLQFKHEQFYSTRHETTLAPCLLVCLSHNSRESTPLSVRELEILASIFGLQVVVIIQLTQELNDCLLDSYLLPRNMSSLLTSAVGRQL